MTVSSFLTCILELDTGAEDVWDEDSAYLEMLANEVSHPLFFSCRPATTLTWSTPRAPV